MRFKTKRIKKEYDQLQEKNPMLLQVVRFIEEFSVDNYSLVPWLTGILRTEEEQIAIYGFAKPSVHLYWRGADIRSWIYTPEQINEIVRAVNEKFEYDPNRKGDYKVAIFHDVGKGPHLHLQVHPNTTMEDKGQTVTINKVKKNV